MKTRLLEIIHLRGLTRKQVANDLGIEKRTLDNYVNEKTQMNAELIKRMATYFKVSTDYLLNFQEKDDEFLNEEFSLICLRLKEFLFEMRKK